MAGTPWPRFTEMLMERSYRSKLPWGQRGRIPGMYRFYGRGKVWEIALELEGNYV